MSGPIAVLSGDELSQIVEKAVRKVLADRAEPAEWLTSAGVAKLLGIHQKTVERRARNGELPARKLGHVWRFRRSDVEAYLGAGTP